LLVYGLQIGLRTIPGFFFFSNHHIIPADGSNTSSYFLGDSVALYRSISDCFPFREQTRLYKGN